MEFQRKEIIIILTRIYGVFLDYRATIDSGSQNPEALGAPSSRPKTPLITNG
jgi:hypothetical protein